MKYGFLSGGTGTPKLLEGFRTIFPDDKLGVVCNTGDDYLWHGLRISPDLDTIIYLFSGKLDVHKYWGVKDDTFNALDSMKSMGFDEWFNVGDKDLALHVIRQEFLRNNTLSNFVDYISEKWGIKSLIAPMADNLIQSQIFDGKRYYHFQEYFVKYKTNIDVKDVRYIGNKERASENAIKIIKNASNVIIGPSNPITSIGPILSITPLFRILNEYRDKIIAISPIVDDKAFSGPTIKLMKAMGIQTNVIGLAEYYKDIISYLVLDPVEKENKTKIEDMGIEVIFENIKMDNKIQKENLARVIIDMF